MNVFCLVPSENSRRFFDGTCVSYRSPTVVDDSDSCEMAEWGIIFDDVRAFGGGYETVDLLDICKAVDDFHKDIQEFPVQLLENNRNSHLFIKSNNNIVDVSIEGSDNDDVDLEDLENQLRIKYERKIVQAVNEAKSEIMENQNKRFKIAESKHKEELSQLKKTLNQEKKVELDALSKDIKNLKQQLELVRVDNSKMIQHLTMNHERELNTLQESERRSRLLAQKRYESADFDSKAGNILLSMKSLSTIVIPVESSSNAVSSPSLASGHMQPSLYKSFHVNSKLSLWKSYRSEIVMNGIGKKKPVVTSKRSSSINECPRVDVTFVKDDSYPIQRTIDMFKGWTTAQQRRYV
jgi:DNA polymerase III gamma/tau subunit